MTALKTFAGRSLNGYSMVPLTVVKIGKIPAVDLISCVVAFTAAHIVKINRRSVNLKALVGLKAYFLALSGALKA